MLKPIARSTLASDTARQLERTIVSGEWPEGTRIPPEPRLVEMLGVGRNTVREAVRALCHLGLLEARPGDGTYVRSNSLLARSLARRIEHCELRQVLETRECLERQAARLAALRRTEEELAALRQGAEELFEQAGSAEPDEVVRLAWEQNLRLVRASGNPLLVDLFESIAEPIREGYLALVHSVRAQGIDPLASRSLNHDLLEAIAAGDADTAERLVQEKNRLILSWLPEEDPTP